MHLGVGRYSESDQQVTVATDELGAAVDHDRCPAAERLGADRCGEGVVDHHLGPLGTGRSTDRRQIGQVEGGVGGRLHPHHVGSPGGCHNGPLVGDVDHAHLDLPLPAQVLYQFPDPEVGTGGQHQHPWREGEEGCGGGGHAAGKGHRAATLQGADSFLEAMPGGGSMGAGVVAGLTAIVAGEHDGMVQRITDVSRTTRRHGCGGGMHVPVLADGIAEVYPGGYE